MAKQPNVAMREAESELHLGRPEATLKDKDMDRGVRFEPVRLGGQYSGESAMLGLVRDHLVVVLVPVEDEAIPAEKQGWFMEVGFGPCRGEGRMFRTLEAASDWISRQLPHNWPQEVELA